MYDSTYSVAFFFKKKKKKDRWEEKDLEHPILKKPLHKEFGGRGLSAVMYGLRFLHAS